MAEISPWSFLLVSILATALPRALGAVAAGRVDPNSRVFEWVTAIAYAMAMGLAVRLLLLPTGPLADTPIVDRLLAAAVALVVFFLMRQRFLYGFVAGVAVFWAIEFWRMG
jgi:branched-subunit amino acid transport protein